MECVICFEDIDEQDVYTLQCCGKKAVHESCLNQHAHYYRKEYLKQHQNLDGFIVFCMLCKQDSGYVITRGPSNSIPTTLPSDTIGTVSGFTSLINAGSDSDPSYEPEVPLNDHEVQTIAEEPVMGQTYCACCFKLIDEFDDRVSLNCCGKLMHEHCQSVTTSTLQKLDMNKSYRGASCIVCASARFMIAKEYAMVCDERSVTVVNGIHPLAASPNAHYMITRCVLYLYGYNFQEHNPWSLKLLFAKFPDLLAELDEAKKYFVQSQKDMDILMSISTTTVHKLRNVFLDPDRALDIFGRIPNCERIMFILYRIHREARMLYPVVYAALMDFHARVVDEIANATTNSIVRPPKHTCMKPCCRTMCVEAHPIIRVPTVGPLPAPSAPSYIGRRLLNETNEFCAKYVRDPDTNIVVAPDDMDEANEFCAKYIRDANNVVTPDDMETQLKNIARFLPKPGDQGAGPSNHVQVFNGSLFSSLGEYMNHQDSQLVQPFGASAAAPSAAAPSAAAPSAAAVSVDPSPARARVEQERTNRAIHNDVKGKGPEDIQRTPPRSMSGMQGSCIHPTSPGDTESPTEKDGVTKPHLMMCVLNQDEFTWMSMLMKTLKEIGKIDKNSVEDQQTLLKYIIHTDDTEDIQLLYKAFRACGGKDTVKRKRGP